MWAVIRFKKNKLNILKNDLENRLGSTPKIFIPKLKIKKITNKKVIHETNYILGDYLNCFHEKFSSSNILSSIKNLRGLKSWVDYSVSSQKSILNFIDLCKKNSDKNGFLNQSFFELIMKKKGIFIDGPFTNMIFEILEVQKNKLKVLVNKVITVIPKNNNCLFRPL